MRALLLVLPLALLVSCAHSDAPGAPPPGEGHDGPPEDNSPLVTPAEKPWADMTGKERGRYMHKVITPQMKEVFHGFDEKEFAKVNCATCHGEHARENHFKMPSDELPKLPDSPEVFMKTTAKDKPEMVKFMSEHVTPKMAELLGLKPFDPKAPDEKAFGCHNCHQLEHKG